MFFSGTDRQDVLTNVDRVDTEAFNRFTLQNDPELNRPPDISNLLISEFNRNRFQAAGLLKPDVQGVMDVTRVYPPTMAILNQDGATTSTATPATNDIIISSPDDVSSELIIYSWISFDLPAATAYTQDVQIYLALIDTSANTLFEQPLAYYIALRNTGDQTTPLIGGYGSFYNLDNIKIYLQGVNPVYMIHPFALRLRIIADAGVVYQLRSTVIYNTASQPITDLFKY